MPNTDDISSSTELSLTPEGITVSLVRQQGMPAPASCRRAVRAYENAGTFNPLKENTATNALIIGVRDENERGSEQRFELGEARVY